MSLLHRALLSAAFKEMIQKFEPIVQETLETAVAVVAPAEAPVIDAGLELAAAAAGLGVTSSDHVAAAVAAATAPPAGAVSPTPPAVSVAANAPTAAAAPTGGAAMAALAACDSIANTLATLATQLAAIRSNLK